MENNQTRLDEIEEAFMLFSALVAGEPYDATPAAQRRYAELMQGMGDRFTKRKESKF